MPRRLAPAAVALAMATGAAALGLLTAGPVTAEGVQAHPTGSDFNGDGVGDLAIGVPNEDTRAFTDMGVVNVIYGTSTNGLTSFNDQLWSEGSAGILGDSESGDRFGYSLATGDFDADGYDDLAVGSPYEDAAAGVVHVLYGTPTGLASDGNQLWSQDSAGMPETAAASDRFGWALTVEDFDGDGFADLAVGVPGEDLLPTDAGGVHVIYWNGCRSGRHRDPVLEPADRRHRGQRRGDRRVRPLAGRR